MDTKVFDAFVDEGWDDHSDRSTMIAAAGLAEETGEAMSYIKRYFRGDLPENLGDPVFDRYAFGKELGDILNYLTRLAHWQNLTLEDVINMNIKKLTMRRDKGTVKGRGDDR